MRNKRADRIISLFVALFLLTFLASGCASSDGIGEIAVIVKATDSDFWRSVSDGVKAASTEYNVTTTFTGPDNEEDYLTQNSMIVSAVARGVDAIVVSAIDYELSADAIDAAAAAGVRVIMIDSGVDSDKTECFIGTDNSEAGRLAGEAAMNLFPGGKAVIGLVNCESEAENLVERERALKAFIAENNGTIAGEVSVPSDTESARLGALELISEHPEINVLVGFNEWSTLGIGFAIREKGLSESVSAVGFDNNIISVGMLETGEMDVLLVQNPFAIGYLGVQCAVELLSGNRVSELTQTATSVITKDNMFDSGNQRILFRFG